MLLICLCFLKTLNYYLMAYRFTNTDKWCDGWFSELKPSSKLTFLYLCDLCDVAGFIEINSKRIAFDCGLNKQDVEVALGELKSKLIFSKCRKYAFIINFIKHQKNLPLNEQNNAHKGIVKRLNENIEIFGFQSIDDFYISPSLAPNKPLTRGIGRGNSNSNGKIEGVTGGDKNWRNDFETYLSELRVCYSNLINDKDFIENLRKYHPKVDIQLSLEKACVEYWATEAGWNKKIKSKSKKIDWKQTFVNALNLKSNKVYNG